MDYTHLNNGSSVLICCDSTENLDKNCGLVFFLGNRWSPQGLKESAEKNLFDIDVQVFDREILNLLSILSVENFQLCERTSKFHLCFQELYWKFLYYFQFRKRVEALIKDYSPTAVHLSSSGDDHLIYACRAACLKYKVEFHVHKGSYKRPLAAELAFKASLNDIPALITPLSFLWAFFSALYLRLKGVEWLFQAYRNFNGEDYKFLGRINSDFSLRKVGGFFLDSLRRRYVKKSNINQSVGTQVEIKFPDNDEILNSVFDQYDFKYINDQYRIDSKKIRSKSVRSLLSLLKLFFRVSGCRAIVLHSENTLLSSLIALSAKPMGVEVFYVPHGVDVEKICLPHFFAKKFGADTLIAWSRCSARAYTLAGRKSLYSPHPYWKHFGPRAKSLPLGWGTFSVATVFTSEWVRLSMAGRPDCFERDLCDVLESLSVVGISRVNVKVKDCDESWYSEKVEGVLRIASRFGLDIKLLDRRIESRISSTENEVVIICGLTTGIIEKVLDGCAVICYRSFLDDVAVCRKLTLPHASDPPGLQILLNDYPKMDLIQARNDLAQRLGMKLA